MLLSFDLITTAVSQPFKNKICALKNQQNASAKETESFKITEKVGNACAVVAYI